jgi:xylulose-5-phosphate/fructose-6-phosphate phosphoketolase
VSVTSSGAGATAAATSDDLAAVDAWWRAIEYLGLVQTHLAANPLLRRPLESEHLRPHPSGQPGTSAVPGFVHAHASALVRRTGQRMIYVVDPRAAGTVLVAASWLEGRYSEVHPEVSRDEAGLERLCREATRGRVSPATPGTVHGDGELGDVLAHAFGAVLDAPDLVALTVIGEDEAETAPLEASWKDVRFLDARRDGAVLPVLHLGDTEAVTGRRRPGGRPPRYAPCSRATATRSSMSRAVTRPGCTSGSPPCSPGRSPTSTPSSSGPVGTTTGRPGGRAGR